MAGPLPAGGVEGPDDEFLHHVSRGAALLADGEPAPARASLSRALELRPRDPQALGLLGQAWYRLGRFDEAVETYGRLVEVAPGEAAARVNLGLASLKARRQGEAVGHFEAALALNPGHRKAMGYLGLAWLEAGDVARAREWFAQAGSDQMVARCDELLERSRRAPEPDVPETSGVPAALVPADAAAEVPSEEVPSEEAVAPAQQPEEEPPAAAAPAAEPPLAGAEPEEPPAAEARLAAGGVPGQVGEAALAPPAAATEPEPPAPAPPELASVPAPVPTAEPPSAGLVPAPPSGPTTLAELAEARLVLPGAVETFAVGRGLLTVAVRGEVLARGRGLVSVRGAVRLTPEVKRFRGAPTEKPFGEGPDRMLRASGEGALVYRAGERRLTAVELTGGSGYFREDAVFGLEGSLAYENGRVASRLGVDLCLVHLRGRGRFLLATAGELAALAVTADTPVRVPLAALAGWTGSLTPRVAPLVEGGDPAEPAGPLAVELTGAGRVLLDPEASPGAASQA